MNTVLKKFRICVIVIERNLIKMYKKDVFMKKKIVATIVSCLMIFNISVFAMTTQEFDAGMEKGISYFNQGLYYEAKDEFTWFKDYNYDRMNSGQQKYLDDYLDGAWDRIEQWENSQADDYSVSLLKDYARRYIWSIYNEDTNSAFTNVKFLITDVTGDGKDDLLAVGIDSGNNPSQIEVYIEENGDVIKIINDHWGGYNGGRVFPTRYNGQVYLCGESFSSGTGFLLNLIIYENGSWRTAYSCHAVYDWDANTWAGYDVNGRMVSEFEYDNFRNSILSNELSVYDFTDRNNL